MVCPGGGCPGCHFWEESSEGGRQAREQSFPPYVSVPAISPEQGPLRNADTWAPIQTYQRWACSRRKLTRVTQAMLWQAFQVTLMPAHLRGALGALICSLKIHFNYIKWGTGENIWIKEDTFLSYQFSILSVQWSPGSFKKYQCLGPSLRDFDLISLRFGVSIGNF